MNKLWLLLLCAVSASGQVITTPGAVSVGIGTISTNSVGVNNNGIVFWDDFTTTGPMNSTTWMQRRSPSGHSYTVYGNPADTTNGFYVANGVWQQTNTVPGALYMGVTNNGPRPWNRAGGVFRFVTNGGSIVPNFSAPVIIHHEFSQFANSGLDYLHDGLDASGQIILQRGVAGYGSFEDILRDVGADGNIYLRDKVWIDEYFFTNCIIMSLNGYVVSAVATNLSFAFAVRCPIWEINGSWTNSIHVEWDQIWAGYASPEMELLARMAGRIGTNGTMLANVTRPTLLGPGGGTYTNSPSDIIIGIPPSSGVGAGRTNKLIAIGTKNVGKEITVYDDGKSAGNVNSNVWILAIDGAVINGGAPLTNINTDGGSMTLISTPQGWFVKSKF